MQGRKNVKTEDWVGNGLEAAHRAYLGTGEGTADDVQNKKAAEFAALFALFGFTRTLAGNESGVNSQPWEYEHLQYYPGSKNKSANNYIIHFFSSALPAFPAATFS